MSSISDLGHLLREREDGVARHIPGSLDAMVFEHLQHTISADIGAEDTTGDVTRCQLCAIASVDPSASLVRSSMPQEL